MFSAVPRNKVDRRLIQSSRQNDRYSGWIFDPQKYLTKRQYFLIVLIQSNRFMQPFFFIRYPTAFFAQEFRMSNDIIERFKFLSNVILFPFAKPFFFFFHLVSP